MKKCYVLFILLSSIAFFGGFLGTSIGTTYGPLIRQGDLVYLGAFRVPKGDLGDDSTSYDRLGYGGSAIAFNPLRNSLFIVGHPYGNRVVEISIPEIVNSNNLNDLKTATVVQAAIDITEGHLAELGLDGSVLSHPVPGGFLLFNGRLIGTAYVYYDGGYQGYRSHFYASPNWSETGPNFHGMYRVGEADGGGPNGGFVGGYMALIPPEWRAELGGPALTGLGGISVISRSSYGPCAWVFNPGDIGDKDPVPATMLVGYPQAHTTLGNWSEPSLYFNRVTEIRGLVFPYGTSSVLFYGRHGLGKTGQGDTCYGAGTSDPSLDGQEINGIEYCYDPTDSSKGCHGYPYVYRIWAYDAHDLAKVKSGEMEPWDVKPYAIWNLDFPFGIENAHIMGAAYDPATQRIFISQYGGEQSGYEPYPIIYVYRVNIPSGEGTGQPPGNPPNLRKVSQ